MRSDVELSSHARSLLRAAKSDAPSALVRGKIWGGVSAGVGGGAAGAAGAGASGALFSSKLLLAGALFGGAITVGLAATLLFVHASSPADAAEPHAAISALAPPTDDTLRSASASEAPVVAIAEPTPAAPRSFSAGRAVALPPRGRFATPHVPGGAPSMQENLSAPPIAAPKDGHASVTNGAHPGDGRAFGRGSADRGDDVRASEGEDDLMREASLVAEARGALARGDAVGALARVRLARSLPSKQLGPEELALEAQALRALGKAAEADGAEGKLRAQYPDHALAR